MSLNTSITCYYYDENHLKRSYKIYYNNIKKSFTDHTDHNKNNEDISWINIKENSQLVIHYTNDSTKTIKALESIDINHQYKELIQDKGLISIKGEDKFKIGEFTKRRLVLNQEENMINMINIIKVYTCLEKEIEEKFNYINNNQSDPESIFNFMINYSSYLGLQNPNNYEARDIVLKQLCIGIIISKINTINNNDNPNIENIKYLFCFKRDIAKTIIDYLKDEPLDKIIQIIDELFKNYDITKFNESWNENSIYDLKRLLSNIEQQLSSKNNKKLLTLSNK